MGSCKPPSGCVTDKSFIITCISFEVELFTGVFFATWNYFHDAVLSSDYHHGHTFELSHVLSYIEVNTVQWL